MMDKKYKILVIACAFLLILVFVSCGKASSDSSLELATGTPFFCSETLQGEIPTVTITPTPFPTYSPEEVATVMARMYPTLLVHPEYPTAQAPESSYLDYYQHKLYVGDLYIGKYLIRFWTPDGEESGFGGIVTISTTGQPQTEVEIYDRISIHYLSGSDITGNGTPDLILETQNGQWNGTLIYDLGDIPILVLNLQGQFPQSDHLKYYSTGEDGVYQYFYDFDNNGSLEYVIESFFFDSFEADYCFPHESVILEYTPSDGYIFAFPKFYQYLGYQPPTNLTPNTQPRDEKEKAILYCQLASRYVAFGDIETAKMILTTNLPTADAEQQWQLIQGMFGRLGMEIP